MSKHLRWPGKMMCGNVLSSRGEALSGRILGYVHVGKTTPRIASARRAHEALGTRLHVGHLHVHVIVIHSLREIERRWSCSVLSRTLC